MFEKMLALLQKENSNEVNTNSPHSDPSFENGGVGNAFKFLPKIEFPVFDGSNPGNSVKKCGRYFSLCKVSESQRVDLVSIHVVGKAET